MDNFKGCRRLKLDLNGRGASIFGDNAAGKATVYDAFRRPLHGKDGKGRTDFRIKSPADDGQAAGHAAIASVEAASRVDGPRVTPRREYYERWRTKRGRDL